MFLILWYSNLKILSMENKIVYVEYTHFMTNPMITYFGKNLTNNMQGIKGKTFSCSILNGFDSLFTLT